MTAAGTALARPPGRHAFTAMGGRCELRVHAPGDDGEVDWLLAVGEQLLERLEQQWSRFRHSSALRALNADPSGTAEVPAELAELVDLAVRAWVVTGGRFDPTVADAVVAAGYDRTFAEVAGRVAATPLAAGAAPGCAEIAVDLDLDLVTRPPGLHLDLGGIGKGRAADLVATDLRQLGAAGVSVDLGGDVRVTGVGPQGSWQVAIADPFAPGGELALVHLADGAVATSSTLGRRWEGPDGPRHHLIDPSTSRPTTSGVATTTVVASTCAWAEVVAKAVVVVGRDEGAALVEELGVAALVVGDDGRVTTHGPWSDVADPAPAQAGAGAGARP